MAQCLYCSAPLSTESTLCDYCGSRNDVDLSGIHEYTITTPESPRICPGCELPLQTINISAGKNFLIERCEKCMGLFFDPGELEGILDATITTAFRLDVRRLQLLAEEGCSMPDAIVYHKCPLCRTLMNRNSFGTKSGVVVDMCPKHGVWLDAGELKRLFEWRKAGGQLYHEQIEKEKRHIEEQQKAKKDREREFLRAKGPAPYDVGMSFGNASRHDGSDLLVLTSKIIGKLFG